LLLFASLFRLSLSASVSGSALVWVRFWMEHFTLDPGFRVFLHGTLNFYISFSFSLFKIFFSLLSFYQRRYIKFKYCRLWFLKHTVPILPRRVRKPFVIKGSGSYNLLFSVSLLLDPDPDEREPQCVSVGIRIQTHCLLFLTKRSV
jgi:hypothetical protein